MARRLPKPFQRPSISVSTLDVKKREWRVVHPRFLSVGDIIPDKGEIDCLFRSQSFIRIRFINGNEEIYGRDEMVNAFTRGSGA